MKLMVFVITIVFSITAFSQTRIEVTPKRPVYCQISDYEVVNWVYGLNKVSENNSTAVFEFNIQYGSCVDGERLPVKLNKKMVMLELERNDNILPGILKDGVKRKVTQVEADELHVELTFDKNFVFKKSNNKVFQMYFLPGIPYGPYYWQRAANGAVYPVQAHLQFIWNINLSLESNEIKMMIH